MSYSKENILSMSKRQLYESKEKNDKEIVISGGRYFVIKNN